MTSAGAGDGGRWPGHAEPLAPRDGSLLGLARALYAHRHFIASLVRREFRVRSVRAVWGSAWLLIEPATQILIYTVIFGQVLGARLPGERDAMAYGVYVCAGVITWNYFSDLVLRGRMLFLDHADLLRTVQFPRSTLPVAMLGAATLNFLIVAGLFLIALGLTGRWPGLSLLGALPLLALMAAIGLGLGVLAGTFNVFFRDTGNVVAVLMQFWFWLTPIVYPIEVVPAALRPAFAWNPLAPLMRGYQDIAIAGRWPDFASLWPPALLALVVLALGLVVFRALGPDLVDEL